MITEYVMKTEELLELSRGTIRFQIEQEPIRYNDMAGRGVMTGPEVMLYLTYSSLSLAEDPQRLIALKIGLGSTNSYAEDFKTKLRTIREEAPKEILQYLDDDGFIKGDSESNDKRKSLYAHIGHGKRLIKEGGFE